MRVFICRKALKNQQNDYEDHVPTESQAEILVDLHIHDSIGSGHTMFYKIIFSSYR